MGTASTLGLGGPARWSLRLFGGFELSALPGGERLSSLGKRERALLSYVVLSPNFRQPRRKLTTMLWGDAADETTLDNLRTSVWRLRKALGDSEHRIVASDGEDVVLDASAFDVDALAFRRLAVRSDLKDLEEAATLYSGALLDSFDIDSEEFESWRRAEAMQYRDQAIDVLTRLMLRLGESGETERAIQIGQRILALEPLHDAAVRGVMRLYAESGRRGAAIETYRTLDDALRSELDAKPEPETRAVLAEIARGPLAGAMLPPSTSAPHSSDRPDTPPPSAQQLGPTGDERRFTWTRRRAWFLSGGLAFATAIALIYHLDGGSGTTAAQQPAGIKAGAITSDLDSHQLYLGARTHLRAYRSRPGDAVGILERAVMRNPDDAPAWALLGLAYASGLFNVASSFDIPIQEARTVVNTVLSKAEEAARRAIDLDDRLADAYASLAFIQEKRRNYLLAEELYLKALELDRDNPEALHLYSSLLAGVGRLDEAVTMKQRLLTLEPFVPTYNQIAAWVLWSNGQTDAAIAIFEAMTPVDRGPLLAAVYASQGRFSDAVDELTSRNPNSGTAAVLRLAPGPAPSPHALPRLDLTSFAYIYVGAADRFLESIERQIEAGYSDPSRNVEVWHPSPPYAAIRQTDRFKAFARNAGLVDYWRVKGWPEFCRPNGADDFVCH